MANVLLKILWQSCLEIADTMRQSWEKSESSEVTRRMRSASFVAWIQVADFVYVLHWLCITKSLY